jgi:hypothetical protein
LYEAGYYGGLAKATGDLVLSDAIAYYDIKAEERVKLLVDQVT